MHVIISAIRQYYYIIIPLFKNDNRYTDLTIKAIIIGLKINRIHSMVTDAFIAASLVPDAKMEPEKARAIVPIINVKNYEEIYNSYCEEFSKVCKEVADAAKEFLEARNSKPETSVLH